MKKIIVLLICTITIITLFVLPAFAVAPTYLSVEQIEAIRALPLFGQRDSEFLVWRESTQTYIYLLFNPYEDTYFSTQYPFWVNGASVYTSSDCITWNLEYSTPPEQRNTLTGGKETWISTIADGTNTNEVIISSKEDLRWTDGIVFFSKSTPYMEILLNLPNLAQKVEFTPLEQSVKLLPTLTLLVVFSVGFWKAWRMLSRLLATA